MSKRFFVGIFSILISVGLVLWGCSDDYDDSGLKNQINDLDARLKAFEEWQELVNNEIAALKTLFESQLNGDYITGVTEIPGGKGYIISFANSLPITINHGKNGTNSKISAINEDGVWYWIIDGEKISDGEGGFVKASGYAGNDGENGITPVIRINPDDEKWEYSVDYDEYDTIWISTGVVAVGKGKDGDSFIYGIDNSNDDFVEFTLAGAEPRETFRIAKYKPLEMLFNQPDEFNDFNQIQKITYTVTGGASEVSVISVPAFWSINTKSGKTEQPDTLIIISPSKFAMNNGRGKATISVSDGQSRTILKQMDLVLAGAFVNKTISRGTAIATSFIPAGSFMIGQTNLASPVHQVTFTDDFLISRTEITNSQFAEFLNAEGIGADGKTNAIQFGGTSEQQIIWTNASGVVWNLTKWEAQSGFENYPVVNVNWFGAKAYCVWAGGDLPTEAQWEYTARAGTTTDYPWGAISDTLDWEYKNYIHFKDDGKSGNTIEVGSLLQNNWGLFDMSGNVSEWVSDWYGSYDSESKVNPTGPSSGSYRVYRGGSWNSIAQDCRIAVRKLYSSRTNYGYLGFRVVFAIN